MPNIWKVQLAYYLASDADLNNSQQEFILQTIDFLTPEAFEFPKADVERIKFEEEVQKFETEAQQLFTKEKAFEIFARLGFSGNCESPNIYSEMPEIASECSCSQSYGGCSTTNFCASGGCNSTWYGCGFIYVQSCNGECRRR